MKVTMKDRKIPLRKDGYPDFDRLNYQGSSDDEVAAARQKNNSKPSLLDVFTPVEVVELVNRALYQLDYQKTAHQKYQQRQRDFQAPIKAKLKELFPSVSWLKATPEQIQQAMEEVYPKEEKSGGEPK
jgi:hypothetical protein